MHKVKTAHDGQTCRHMLPADRNGSEEECRENAVVEINEVPYCAVHADYHCKNWKEKLAAKSVHQIVQKVRLFGQP